MAESRVAPITGSSPGIRAAAAHRFGAAALRVVASAARGEEAGKALAAELPGASAYRVTHPARRTRGGSRGAPPAAMDGSASRSTLRG